MGKETIGNSAQKPVIQHTLEIGRFSYYPHMSISEVNEGVHMDSKKMSGLLQIAKDVYGDDIPFIYISNRVHSYSIDPLGYYEAIKMFPNLKGYAIVSKDDRLRTLALLEKLFMKKPIRIFDDLDKAKKWAQQLITEAPK